MAVQKARAVYHHGYLELLDPVDLAEGQRVYVIVTPERDTVEAALGDLLGRTPPSLEDEEDIDEEAILRDLHEATRGLPPASELIIEERRNGS